MNTASDGSVLYNRNGTPCQSFRTAFEKAVRKAGLVGFTYHDLSHIFASRLVMSRNDLPTVEELLGPKGISMILYYTYLCADHKQHAVRLLEQFGGKVRAIFTTDTQQHSAERLQAIATSERPLSSAG